MDKAKFGARIRVKVCGLTNLPDVQAAVRAGADLVGFIFYPESPRYVTPERVRDVLSAVDRGQANVVTVGVFVNESAQTIAQILDFCGLDLAQLHGEEGPAMLGLVRGPDDQVEDRGHSPLRGRAYKALRPHCAEEATALAQRYALPSPLRGGEYLPAFLIDAYHPRLRGGTGQTGDWRLAARLAGRYPLLLAGGLTPTNVAQAVRAVRPWGVDVASGVEALPGQKDHAALQAFIAAVRSQ